MTACLLLRSLRCLAASFFMLLVPEFQLCVLQISKFKLAFMNSLLYILKLKSKSIFQPELDSIECGQRAGIDQSSGPCSHIREENASFQYEFFGLLFVLFPWFLLLVTISCSMPVLNGGLPPCCAFPGKCVLLPGAAIGYVGVGYVEMGFASPGSPMLALMDIALHYEALILQFLSVKRKAGPGTTVTFAW